MRNSKRNKFSAKREAHKQIHEQLSYFMANIWGDIDFIPDDTNQFVHPQSYMQGNNFSVRLSKQ
jgi:hypothetical protein